MLLHSAHPGGPYDRLLVFLREPGRELEIYHDLPYHPLPVVSRLPEHQAHAVGRDIACLTEGKDIIAHAGSDGSDEEVERCRSRTVTPASYRLIGPYRKALIESIDLFPAREHDLHIHWITSSEPVRCGYPPAPFQSSLEPFPAPGPWYRSLQRAGPSGGARPPASGTRAG